MKDFDIEKLERRNIYKTPDNLFENIQLHVMNDVRNEKENKTPIFKLYWAYAAAAVVALIFGSIFIFNSQNDFTIKNQDNAKGTYVSNTQESKTEGQIAYETLKSDLTSIENNSPKYNTQEDREVLYTQNKEEKIKEKQTVIPASKQDESRMNEYLDSFTNSEIVELASNSTQDVYLDLYN
ncbi:hypothetical protein [Chryseobacterium potabilaquae]|uniref:Uncharacterized protein n=1 Tax=Chryseobacterium potabilaquae TaxID=2675057 RepID=A0A6N4X526_9FLAO|nr:hypothetical protein [Chryseobacterium potabilaquae]CAA7195171.1 hypothetical protein CHRY9293_01413 [Chryseobacterium potabilaquae]